MFTTSNGSSPQTAPTTPESLSNNSDDYNGGGGSSTNEWGTGHDSDAWPTGHHDWATSSQNSDSLSTTAAEWTNGSTGWANNDWANSSNDWTAGLGLGFLNNNAGNINEAPSDEQLANMTGNPELPLQDLIHDSLLSNSPVVTVRTVPNHFINTAWLNRNSSGNNLALNTNAIGLGMTSSPVTSPTSTTSHKQSFTPHPSTISPAGSQLHNASLSRNASFSQLAAQHHPLPPSADPTTLFAPYASPMATSTTGNQQLGMTGNRHSLATTQDSMTVAARPLNEHGAGLFTQAAQPRSMYRLTVHDVPPKSRVETQVRLRIELDDVSTPAGLNGPRRPAELWKFIRIPKTASVKTRNVKGQCEPDQSTVLTLSASIYCASNTAYKDKPVPCCESCQKREEKRNNKKASSYNGAHAKGTAPRGSASSSRHGTAPSSKNATPATSESELGGPLSFSEYPYDLTNGYASAGPSDGNYVSPIDFTCQQMLDFTGGTAQLCFRVICYCRHYKEKTGFIIRLTLQDFHGNVVGEVKTTPIMIMDDHKSTGKPTPAHTAEEDEVDSSAHARRRKRMSRMEEDEDDIPQAVHSGGVGAIRNKPRPTRMTALSRLNASSSKPVASGSGTSHGNSHGGSAVVRGTASESPLATTAPSSPAGFSPPPTTATVAVKTEMDGVQYGAMPVFPQSQPQPQLHPHSGLSSPLSAGMANLPMPSMVQSVNGFINPIPPPPQNPFPNIQRLVPNSGPTTGGIEVILLGANFSIESLTGCYIAFGHQCVPIGITGNGGIPGMGMDPNGAIAIPGAQVLSENTLHCTLPPSPLSGPVPVKLLGVPPPPGQTEADADRLAPLFTYTEEGDRDLMMKALQILGLRNGQMPDARSIAMNIIHSSAQQNGMMNMSNAGTADPSYMPMNYSMHSEPSASKRIEDLVINVLRSAQSPETGVIKGISQSHSPTGQTLLHLSSAMGLSKLTRALINWGAEVNLQDRNGFTPVHFACFYGRLDCIDILVRVGRAHLEGKDAQGRTPFKVSNNDKVSFLLNELRDEVETRQQRPAVSEFESGGEGDDEGDDSSPWSGSDQDENDSDYSGYGAYKTGKTGTLRARNPVPITGAAAPQPMARRISRVSSFASNISQHSHKSQRSSTSRVPSRTGTPFAPEMTISPLTNIPAQAQAPAQTQPYVQPLSLPESQIVTTPTTPTPTGPSRRLPEPTSPGSQWRLPRGVPNMPWPMQLPAGWQFPAVPGMPQFGLRRGSGSGGNEENSESGDTSKKGETEPAPASEAEAQAAQAQMFMWMMEYLRRTVGWDFNMIQQQAQARSAAVPLDTAAAAAAATAEMDNDPPPYSPGGVAGPEEKFAQASQMSQAAQVTQTTQTTQTTTTPAAQVPFVTPAAPIVLTEPPSPLSLDSPFGSPAIVQKSLDVHQLHTQSSQHDLQAQSTTTVHPTSGDVLRSRHSHSHLQHPVPRHHSQKQREPEVEEVDIGSPEAAFASVALVRRREKKKQDKMLIYFWIPVLILVIAWASYKPLYNVYRVLAPAQRSQEMPTRTNILV